MRFVRRRGQRKSDVGRAAIAEYLDRHDDDGDFENHLVETARFEAANAAVRRDLDETNAAAWRNTQAL